MKPLDEPPLLLSNAKGQNGWEDFPNDKDFGGTQAIAGYAPSPYVPFRVQVKARDSIPDSELGNVPNAEVRKADDPKGDAGTLTPGQKSNSPGGTVVADATVPIPATDEKSLLPETGSSGQDKTLEPGSDLSGGDPLGANSGVIADTVDLGLQGQDTPSDLNGVSNLVNTDPTLTLAFADGAPSSGKSGVQLTDPLFANPNGPSSNSGFVPGSLFASASLAGDDLFLDTGSDSALVASNGPTTQASIFSPEDSATGNDDGNPNNQDESYLRKPDDQIDWSDPCNLVHGSATPFSAECTVSTSRTVLLPFRIPTVPRPDLDIAVDDVAGLP